MCFVNQRVGYSRVFLPPRTGFGRREGTKSLTQPLGSLKLRMFGEYSEKVGDVVVGADGWVIAAD